MRRHVMIAATLLAASSLPGRADTVQVREATVRDRPSFLGQVVARVEYGETLGAGAARGPWIEVARDGHNLGWVHSSALTRRTIQMRAGKEDVDASVSSDELALAGKGFNAQVEAQYRARHGDAGFKELDRMEKMGVSESQRTAFLKQGGLTSKEGGGP